MARSLALLVVVLGHLVLAVIDRHDGEVRGANLLALHPSWAFLAALAPMPVFFAAAGWANASASLASSAARLRTLVGLGAVVVTAWSVAVVVTVVISGDAGIVGDGARLATQPLWFVAAYVPFAAAGRHLARLAAAHPIQVVAGILVLLATIDVVRFGLGELDWIGWPAFYLAWGIPWLAGGWWRARYDAGDLDERRTGAVLALGAVVGCAALIALAGYDPALIDAVPGARSNTTPPTLYTATAALAQVGLLIAGSRALDGVGRRWQRLWDRAGGAAVAVYAWHLTALALCAAVIAAGLPVPERLTTLWWTTRPLWWAAILGVTSLFVAATAVARRGLASAPRRIAPPTPHQIVTAVLVAAAGGAMVGLRGPRTVGLATACSLLFVAAWLLLRPRPERGTA